MLSRFFFLTSCVSHGTLYLSLSLVGMHSAVASMLALTKFSYSSFEYLFQISTEEYWFFYSYFLFIANISIVNWGQVVSCGFDCFYFISAQTQVCLSYENSVIGRCSFKRGACLRVRRAIYSLLVDEYVIYWYFSIICLGVGP